jgi:hypothetical protein
MVHWFNPQQPPTKVQCSKKRLKTIRLLPKSRSKRKTTQVHWPKAKRVWQINQRFRIMNSYHSRESTQWGYCQRLIRLRSLSTLILIRRVRFRRLIKIWSLLSMRLRNENCLTNCSSTPTNTLDHLPNLETPRWFSNPESTHRKSKQMHNWPTNNCWWFSSSLTRSSMRLTVFLLTLAIKLFYKTYLQSIQVRYKAPRTKKIPSSSQLKWRNQSVNQNPLPTPNTSSKHQLPCNKTNAKKPPKYPRPRQNAKDSSNWVHVMVLSLDHLWMKNNWLALMRPGIKMRVIIVGESTTQITAVKLIR